MKNVNIDIIPILYEIARGQMSKIEYNDTIPNDKKEATSFLIRKFENKPIVIERIKSVIEKGKQQKYIGKKKRMPLLVHEIIEQYCVSKSVAIQAIANFKRNM